jgi:hypothetical protein
LDKGDTRTDIDKANADIKSNISFKEFMDKYPSAKAEMDVLVLKYSYWDEYRKHQVVEFSSVLPERRLGINDRPQIYNEPVNEKWISHYSDGRLNAFYFTTEFQKHVLPLEYARMVQYSDCMIDTSTQVFSSDATHEYIPTNKVPPAITRLNIYIEKEIDYVVNQSPERRKYQDEYLKWDSIRRYIIDDIISKKPEFHKLLKSAASAALEKGGSNDYLESLVSSYYSKKIALQLKRNRIVIGNCSQDERPRWHAVNIAVLSAESVSWETFLRAHLDIMNDRFQRMSDGSYAWAERQTYIKELEEIDIDVLDLMFGIVFRLENPSQNHYYGSIGRLGRALSETRYPEQVEKRMLKMIRDEKLDNYNRLLMYWLFFNYNHYMKDRQRQESNKDALKDAVNTLPEYLARRIKTK